jgi:hypothetical protein
MIDERPPVNKDSSAAADPKPKARRSTRRKATASSNGRVPAIPAGAAGPIAPGLAGIPGIEVGSATTMGTVEWLWPDRIPLNMLSLIEGRKGRGKSTLLTAIAAAVTGGPAPPGWIVRPARSVMWCYTEELWDAVILPRLKAAGANLDLVCRPRLKDERGRDRRLTLPSMLDELRQLLKQARPGLLGLDPFTALKDSGLDMRQDDHVRSYLEPLVELLSECDCTCVMDRHLRKGSHGDVLDQGLGGVAVANMARAIHRCDIHTTNDALRVFSPVIVSNAKNPPALNYSFQEEGDTLRLIWSGESNISAEVLAEGKASASDRDEARDAENLLRSKLAGGSKQFKDLEEEAGQAGVTVKQLRAAKTALGVTSRRLSVGRDGKGAWLWDPPEGGFPPEE